MTGFALRVSLFSISLMQLFRIHFQGLGKKKQKKKERKEKRFHFIVHLSEILKPFAVFYHIRLVKSHSFE